MHLIVDFIHFQEHVAPQLLQPKFFNPFYASTSVGVEIIRLSDNDKRRKAIRIPSVAVVDNTTAMHIPRIASMAPKR